MFALKWLRYRVALFAGMLLVVATSALAGEAPPAQPQPMQTPSTALPDKRPDTKAVVTGSADALAAFHKQLVNYMKVPAVEQGGVGCLGCGERLEQDLVTQKPMRVYTFVGSPRLMNGFMAAWNAVRSQSVALTLGNFDSPDPNCGGKPSPCTPNYFCPGLGYCSSTTPRCTPCA
jgi:hypothetical protein